MKHLILTSFLFAFATFNSNAQSRENKKIVQFSSKSEKLTEATGWEQNKETGKWIENKNVIADRKCPSYWVSQASQSFSWMQFATITNGQTEYYVFLYERLGGEYKYPNIREDWETDLRTYFFILTPTEYENIKTQIDLKSGENIKVTSNKSSHISDRYKSLGEEHLYNNENLLAKITNTIEDTGISETSFILNSQVIDGQEVVRFRLPEIVFSSEDYIKTKYFEVKSTDFKTIFTRLKEIEYAKLKEIEYANYGEEEKIYDAPIMTRAERMPVFPGECQEIANAKDQDQCTQGKIINFVQSNTDYPEIAKENGFQGKVFLTFIVDENGNVGNVEILKGIHKSLDDSATKAVMKLPKFTPASQRGKPVKIKYTIPVNFRAR